MADYSANLWSTGDVVTAALLNHGEGQYSAAKTEFTAGNWGQVNGTLKAYKLAGNPTYNPSGQSYLDFRDPSGDLLMWALGITGAKSGSNAGGDLTFYAYTDAGAYLGNWVTLKRSDGTVSLLGPLQMGGSTVLTAARVLQNVTLSGSLINAGSVAAAYVGATVKTMVLSAQGIKPRISNGCASLAWFETTTNKVNRAALDFDQTTQEYAQVTIPMPQGYDGGVVTVWFKWTAAGGTAAQTCIWGIQARAFGDDDALDQAFGTALEISDAFITAGDVHVTSSGSLTIAGTPAGGKDVTFQIYRKSSDTLAADARLLEVVIEYGTAYTD